MRETAGKTLLKHLRNATGTSGGALKKKHFRNVSGAFGVRRDEAFQESYGSVREALAGWSEMLGRRWNFTGRKKLEENR